MLAAVVADGVGGDGDADHDRPCGEAAGDPPGQVLLWCRVVHLVLLQ
jgi:hypothetical protein